MLGLQSHRRVFTGFYRRPSKTDHGMDGDQELGILRNKLLLIKANVS